MTELLFRIINIYLELAVSAFIVATKLLETNGNRILLLSESDEVSYGNIFTRFSSSPKSDNSN